MKRPTFLSAADVLCIHASTIEREGGTAGIRDHALLTSAVMMPQQQFEGRYLHEDLPAMAAGYLFHITRNHPFLDGNKRAGVMAAYVFLDVNGVDMTATGKELEQTVVAVADGRMSKAELTAWMQEHTRPRRRRR